MDGIGYAASAMAAATSRLDIAAGNLANAGSDGFRRHVAVGKLGRTGATVVAVRSNEQGPLRRTGRPLDLALVGPGNFSVRSAHGGIADTRGGAFERDAAGIVREGLGRALIGEHGALRLPAGASIEPDGSVMRGGKRIDHLAVPRGTTVQSGFLESSNVNAITEMIAVLSAQRSFESAQKVVSAIDATRQKAGNELARLK